jgi:hypothetical protein
MLALVVFGGLLLLVFDYAFSGYVLSMLWGWFVVPTFGAPKLGMVPAIGIVLVVSYLTHQNNLSKSDEGPGVGKEFARSVTNSIGISATALLLGWIIHFFM